MLNFVTFAPNKQTPGLRCMAKMLRNLTTLVICRQLEQRHFFPVSSILVKKSFFKVSFLFQLRSSVFKCKCSFHYLKFSLKEKFVTWQGESVDVETTEAFALVFSTFNCGFVNLKMRMKNAAQFMYNVIFLWNENVFFGKE